MPRQVQSTEGLLQRSCAVSIWWGMERRREQWQGRQCTRVESVTCAAL
jgi:hypothetical protein